jgi:hypothetical protein
LEELIRDVNFSDIVEESSYLNSNGELCGKMEHLYENAGDMQYMERVAIEIATF